MRKAMLTVGLVNRQRRLGDTWRLLVAVSGLALSLMAADRLLQAGMEHLPAYVAAQDPRERILWHSVYDGSPVVLVGDSVFCSYFVDRPADTLWARLSSRLGVSVFPAALDGARPVDVEWIARRVARLWPAGTTALIDVHPARTFTPDESRTTGSGEYADQFAALIPADAQRQPWAPLLDRRFTVALADHSFAVRNHAWVQRFIDVSLKGGVDYFHTERSKDRRWDNTDGFALGRFRALEKSLLQTGEDRSVPFGWLRSLVTILQTRGIRPIIVLTPFNRTLVRQYAGPASSTERRLMESHEYVVAQLKAERIQYVDLFDLLEPSCFADAIHMNRKGDDLVADVLAREVRNEITSRQSKSRDH